jgi:NhaP-type Na+/H+ or K+/H+ antiporter
MGVVVAKLALELVELGLHRGLVVLVALLDELLAGFLLGLALGALPRWPWCWIRLYRSCTASCETDG